MPSLFKINQLLMIQIEFGTITYKSTIERRIAFCAQKQK